MSERLYGRKTLDELEAGIEEMKSIQKLWICAHSGHTVRKLVKRIRELERAMVVIIGLDTCNEYTATIIAKQALELE